MTAQPHARRRGQSYPCATCMRKRKVRLTNVRRRTRGDVLRNKTPLAKTPARSASSLRNASSSPHKSLGPVTSHSPDVLRCELILERDLKSYSEVNLLLGCKVLLLTIILLR